MFAQPPNGYLLRDLIVFNQPAPYGFLAKGFVLELPDLFLAPPTVLNQLQDQLSLLLRSFDEHLRLQFCWYCDADYGAELDQFEAVPDRTSNEWARHVRSERSARYRRRMLKGSLRRQRLVLFVSRAVGTAPALLASSTSIERHAGAALDQGAVEFRQFEEKLHSLFAPLGMRVLSMDDAAHLRHFAHFFNPSLAVRPGFDPVATFDPQRSIQENCWCSEGVGVPDTGFCMDGFYQAILVVTRWPQATHPGIIRRLTDLKLPNVRFTMNIEPLSVRAEIAREEHEHRRLTGDLQAEQKVGLERVIEKKKAKVKGLVEGFIRPFRAQLILQTWALSREALFGQVVALKQAVNSMAGAQYFEAALPGTSKRLWFQSWPGWTWGRYEHHKLYAEDRYLADLIPASSSFVGMQPAEALFDGPQDNLIGVCTFAGDRSSASPQHALVFGGTGSGKSVLLMELLSQTAPDYSLTVIIDYGGSFELYTRTVDPSARPIVIHPNSDVCLNYLDTGGLPVSPEHLSFVVALVSQLSGHSSDEDRERHRQALLSKYVQQLYRDVFEDWARSHPADVIEVGRLACALAARRRATGGAGGLETFVEFRDWQAREPDQAAQFLQQFDDPTVLRFAKDPATRDEVCHLAIARFTPAEQPTHSMLVELMRLDAATEDREQAGHLALQLQRWCRGGDFGSLFDGVTNVFMHGAIVHFELGKIPDSAHELRAAAQFLVTHHAQQFIFSLPRSLRKRIVFEEASSFLTLPQGEKLLRACYEQARKFNTWIVSVFQQYDRVRQSAARAAIVGNCKQFFLLKQNDPHDLQALADDLGLSPRAVDAIAGYAAPGHGQAYSQFTYFHRSHPVPVCGTVHHEPSPEMLYLACSSGAHFEKRRQDLDGDYQNLVPRLVALANQNQTHDS
jgi:hypothetical protein